MPRNDPGLARIIEELRTETAPEENFRRLFVRFQPALHRFFARQGFSAEDCHDLTQETFVGIYRGIGSFRSESSFETWLFKIAVNVYRKHLRRRSADKRRGEEVSLDQPIGEGEETPAERLADDGGSGPEDHLIDREQAGRLLQAVDTLPEKARKCLILRVHQELGYKEIAEVMQLSVETVRSHLFQARRRLKQQLTSDPGSDRG